MSASAPHDKFGVDSTPSFSANGKRLAGEHQVKDFDGLMTGKPQGRHERSPDRWRPAPG